MRGISKMVKVKYTVKNGKYEIDIKGHANYNVGNDIVCAACSNLAYTLAAAILNTEGLQTNNTLGIGDSSIVAIPKDSTEQLIVRTLYKAITLGYLQLAKKYPDHVEVKCPHIL